MVNVALSPETRLLRVNEVAQHLSLSRSMVYGLMEQGQLGFIKIGKSRRIPQAALEKLILESTVAARNRA